MMTKQCTCKQGKNDPKCPSCAGKNKTAEQFKIAFSWSKPPLSILGGMNPKTKALLLKSLQNAAVPALAVGLPSALIAGINADKGDTADAALTAGLGMGGLAAGASVGHNMLMGTKSPLSKAYKPMGSKINDLAETAGLDRLKISYSDPYYGQYSRESRDDGLSGFDKALMLGGGAALAGGLHHTLMNSRGGTARGYQKGIGGSIRSGANTVRSSLGMEPVAQPAGPMMRRVQDAIAGAKNVYAHGKDIAPALTSALGAGVTLKGMHSHLMNDPTNLGELYRPYGKHLDNAGRAVVNAGQRAAGFVADKLHPEPSVMGMRSDKDFERLMGTRGGVKAKRSPEQVKENIRPEVRKPEGPPSPTSFSRDRPQATPGYTKVQSPPGKGAWTSTKKGSMVYDAGSDAALDAYLR